MCSSVVPSEVEGVAGTGSWLAAGWDLQEVPAVERADAHPLHYVDGCRDCCTESCQSSRQCGLSTRLKWVSWGSTGNAVKSIIYAHSCNYICEANEYYYLGDNLCQYRMLDPP